jgi:septum formation protein
MRNFTDVFLDDYIAAEGADVFDSVGAYRLEGKGVQLFEVIEGDHFAILGLPLLELLGFLRTKGMILP